jgi:hypothetical protein
VVAFVVHGVLAHLASTPVVFDDELIYWKAAESLASADGVEVRDGPYVPGLAVLYPVVLAPILWAIEDRELAYELAKILNSLFFALAAIPVYLLARRLLPPWPSAAAAALSVFIPSAMYVSLVMSESLAYLMACSSAYACVLALERPTPARQGAAFLVFLLASATRLQFLAFFPAYLLALAVMPLLLPSRGARPRRSVGVLWPAAFALVLGLGALGYAFLAGERSASSVFGGYTALWGSYDLLDVPRGLVHQLANLSFYLAVAPLVVAPIVLASFTRHARAGSERHGAFVAAFASVNAVFLTLAAVFDVSEHALDRLHDRYAFYVVPLWLILVCVWAYERAPRPLVASGVGAGLALLLAATFPLSALDARDGGKLFEGVGTTIWAALDEAVTSAVAVRAALILFALASVAVVLFLPRRLAWLIPVGVASFVLLSHTVVWGVAINTAQARHEAVFGGPSGERQWVEGHVRSGSSVATVFVPCVAAGLARESFLQTEFFNASVDLAFHVRSGFAYTAPSSPLEITADGSLVLSSNAPIVVDYVVAQPGVPVLGKRVAEGTRARLALWDVGGPVRVTGFRSADELARAVCKAPGVAARG